VKIEKGSSLGGREAKTGGMMPSGWGLGANETRWCEEEEDWGATKLERGLEVGEEGWLAVCERREVRSHKHDAMR